MNLSPKLLRACVKWCGNFPPCFPVANWTPWGLEADSNYTGSQVCTRLIQHCCVRGLQSRRVQSFKARFREQIGNRLTWSENDASTNWNHPRVLNFRLVSDYTSEQCLRPHYPHCTAGKAALCMEPSMDNYRFLYRFTPLRA